jgi:exopolysaccharide production protein ExoY
VRDSVGKLGISGRGVHEDDSRLAALGGLPKRAFDVTMAGIGLLVLIPIMLVTAVLIRLLVGEPVILPEDMIGFGGRVFVAYKFRTKVGNASSNLWAEYFVEALRRSSLDKLPQLFNVMRGDMSLVGPRPRAENELLLFAQAPECLLARPGLTGMWQVYGRSRDRDNRGTEVALDRHYVRHWSMRLDFALLSNAISDHHENRTA